MTLPNSQTCHLCLASYVPTSRDKQFNGVCDDCLAKVNGTMHALDTREKEVKTR